MIIASHAHQYTNIALVLSGNFYETIGQTPHECRPFSLILRPAGETHSIHYSQTGACCLIIEVKPQRLETVRQISPILDRASHLQGGTLPAPLPDLMTRIHQEFRRELWAPDGAAPLAIEAHILELLAHATRQSAVRQSSSEPRWLREARDFIHDQFAQPLSLSSLAARIGVSPTHLAKMFRQHYHCSVGDYLRRVRLDWAARELAQTERMIR